MSKSEPIRSTQVDTDRTSLFAQQRVDVRPRPLVHPSVATQFGTFVRMYSIVERMNRVSNARHRLLVLLQAAVHEIQAAHRGTIYLSTTDRHTFAIGAVYPPDSTRAATEIPAEGGYIDAVAQLQSPSVIPNVQEEGLPPYPCCAEHDPPIRSALVVPFVIGGRTVGVLSLENSEQQNAFTQDDLHLASVLGAFTAGAVDNARPSRARRPAATESCIELSALHDLADAASAGLLVVDDKQRCAWANCHFCDMAARRREDVIGAPVAHLLSMDGADLSRAHDVELIRSDGSHCRASAASINLEEIDLAHVGRYMLVLQDHTEKDLLERQLSQLQRLSNVGGLISGMAHELNNPLTSVIGLSQLVLARNDLSQESRQDLETIAQQAERGAGVVRDLLDYVRCRDQELTEVDVNSLIYNLIRLHTRARRKNALEITLDLADPLPPLRGNARQLQQVLFNLIDNAEYAAASVGRPGKLRIRTRLIYGGTHVRISLRDNGPGIPAAIQPRVFEPFFTTKPSQQGTGLGLSISKRIVEQHGGTIYLESEEGVGTTFLIDLPTMPGMPG